MRTNYDFTTGTVYKYLQSDYKEKMKQAEKADRKKKLEAARLEALKEDERLGIISTMQPIVANINSNIETLSCRIDQLQELETRIITLEKNIADRPWSPNRERKNLRITVRA